MNWKTCMLLAAAAPLYFGSAAIAQDKADAVAVMHDAKGKKIGTVEFRATPSGIALITTAITGVAKGVHGFHIHETGTCTAPDFKSAGGHLTGGKAHGVLDAGGPHAGDLPNVHVQADGVVAVEEFAPALKLGSDGEGALFDKDGSAVILHSGADDYKSQPSGDAGSRIACGVIEKAGS